MKKTIFTLILFFALMISWETASADVSTGNQRNGHGLAGFGMITGADISSVSLSAFDDSDTNNSHDGKVDKIVLSWQPQLSSGDTGLAAWHHWEVRYSETNGQGDGSGSVIISDNEQTDPYLYPSGNRIFYQEPTYNATSPLLSGSGYVPDSFGTLHTATIQGADLERLRGKIVKFQVIEWYYQGVLASEDLDCYPANAPFASDNNYPAGLPINRVDAQGQSLKCFPPGTIQQITSNDGGVCPYSSPDSGYNPARTYCPSLARHVINYPYIDCQYIYYSCSTQRSTLNRNSCYKYLPAGELYSYNEKNLAPPFDVLEQPPGGGYGTCEGSAPPSWWNDYLQWLSIIPEVISQTHTINSNATANQSNTINYNGASYAVRNRPQGNASTNIPQQVLVAVTPGVVFDALTPQFHIDLSNTNNLSGSTDITTAPVSIGSENQITNDSGNHTVINITQDVVTGEEYAVRSYEKDIYGNILTNNADTSTIEHSGSSSGISFELDSNPISTNKGMLIVPNYTGSQRNDDTINIKKTYAGMVNAADYIGEEIAKLNVSAAPSTSISGQTLVPVSQLGKSDLDARITLSNRHPQLELLAKSCSPMQEKIENNIFSVKSTDNMPKIFNCTFVAKNPSGVRDYKLNETADIYNSQNWFNLSYPGARTIQQNGTEMPFTANIDAEQFAVQNGLSTANFRIAAAKIPQIANPLKIVNEAGLNLSSDGQSALVQLLNHVYAKEVAGTEFNRDGGVDLSKLKLPSGGGSATSCTLTSAPAQICSGQSSLLSWQITGDAKSAQIETLNYNIDINNKTGAYPDPLVPITSTFYKMTVTDPSGNLNSCGASITVLNQTQCTTNPVTDNTFQAVFIAGGSVIINRDGLKIFYDPRFLLKAPPGFGQLLAPLWKESTP